MMEGMKAFQNNVELGNTGCIKRILRIKNTFKKLPMNDVQHEMKNDLSNYHYADVKFNVKVEHNNIGVVAEIQFNIPFMMQAKAMGHSLYRYKRRRDFVYQVLDRDVSNAGINKPVNTAKSVNMERRFVEESSNIVGNKMTISKPIMAEHDKIESRLRSIISFQDYNKFNHELLLLTTNILDKRIVKIPYLFEFKFNNGDSLLALLFKNQWIKAMKLYYATVIYFDQIYGARDESVMSHGIDNIIARQESYFQVNGSECLNDFINDESFWNAVVNWKGDIRQEGKSFVYKLAHSVFFKGFQVELY